MRPISLIFLSCLRILLAGALAGVLASPFVASAQAGMTKPLEDYLPVEDSLRTQRTMHVSPRNVVFDARSKSADLTFRNTGSKVITAEVEAVFGYIVYPSNPVYDTMVVTTQWARLIPRDTIVLNPGPKDHFAGRWIAGLPARLTLKPHETRHIRVTIAPPPNLPDGEYWARVYTTVRPPDPQQRPSKPKDERTIYRLPVKGMSPPTLRDSTLVTYRQGNVHMGVEVGKGAMVYEPVTSDLRAAWDSYPMTWFRLPIREGHATVLISSFFSVLRS